MLEMASKMGFGAPEVSGTELCVPKPMQCRACAHEVLPTRKVRNIMSHQSGKTGEFGLFAYILCCPKCGERDL